MSVSCRRPGCTKVAAVTIRYDPVSCQLWLDPITVADRSAQALCLEHAERLSPPRGWVVVDRRGAQTTIVSPPRSSGTEGGPEAAPRRPVRRRWGSFEEPTLDFTAAVVRSEPEPEPVAEVPVHEPEPVAEVPEPEPVPEPVAEAPVAEVPVAEVVVAEEVELVTAAAPDNGADAEPEPPDDIAALLRPRGGLLGRAFEATGHQRSALTIPAEAEESE